MIWVAAWKVNKKNHYIGSKEDLDKKKHIMFIHKGYRINFDSPKMIISSLFIIHNEFVNIWTHLLGSIFCLIFGLYLVLSLEKNA